MLTGGVQDWNANSAGWLEKYQINLDADNWGQRHRGVSALAWYHNL